MSPHGYQGLPGVFDVHHHVEAEGVNVVDSLAVMDNYDQTLSVMVKTAHAVGPGLRGPMITSETTGEVSLTYDEMMKLHAWISRVIAHRAAHEARLPTYSARFLSEEATGDHRIGIYERFTDRVVSLLRVVPSDRDDATVGRALADSGYRVVGPRLGDHLIALGYITDVKETEQP